MSNVLKALQAAYRAGARSPTEAWEFLRGGWGTGRGPLGLWGFGAEKPTSEGVYLFGGAQAMPKGGGVMSDPNRLAFTAHSREKGDPLIGKLELKFDDPDRQLGGLRLPTGLVNIEVPKPLRGQGAGTEILGGLMQLQRSLDEPFSIYDVQKKAAPWWERHMGAVPTEKRGAHVDYEMTPQEFIRSQLQLIRDAE